MIDNRQRDRLYLFLCSFTILFVELACIRWIPAYIRYLGYFTNFVLLGSFLGIGLGVLHPRLATALFGGIIMGVAYTVGLAINYPPGPPWDVPILFNPKLMILVMACIGYDVLGTAAAVITRVLKGEGVGSPPRAV